MSVHPGRVLIGAMTFVIILGVGRLFDVVHRWIAPDASPIFAQWLALWRSIIHGATPLAAIPQELATPYSGGAAGALPLLTLWAILAGVSSIGVGAMARMVAVDIAADADMSIRHALRFALARWAAFIVAAVLPIAIIIGVIVAIGVAGVLLLSVSWLSVIGALLFGLAIIAGVVAAALWLALALGGGMIAPAVACESTDAIDAIQRCVAYVYKRLGHTLLYLLILAGVWVVAMFVVRVVAIGGLGVAESASSMWLRGERTTEVFDSTSRASMSAAVINGWRWIVEILVGGWTLSFAATAGTLMYLALRRVCDDQDPRDLWMESGRFTPVMPETGEGVDADADAEPGELS